MDKKEKKEFNEEDKIIEAEFNDVPQKKELKNEKKKSKDDLSLDEIENLLNQLKEQIDLNGENVKIIKIDRSKPSVKSQIIEALATYVFDFILIISLNGYLKFAESNFFQLLIFSLIFSTIELILRSFLIRYFLRFMIASLGTILIPITILSFIIAWLVIPGLEMTSSGSTLLFIFIFLIARSLIKMFLLRRGSNFIEIKGRIKK